MSPGDGWMIIGPLIAVGLVGFLGAVFWRMGLQWTLRQEAADPLSDLYGDGLSIFGDPDDTGPADFGLRGLLDYGLLRPAAVTGDPDVAVEIRGLLDDAGIRATQVASDDGRVVVLVFAEHLEEARRLVGDSPVL